MVKLGPVREPADPLLNHVCGHLFCLTEEVRDTLNPFNALFSDLGSALCLVEPQTEIRNTPEVCVFKRPSVAVCTTSVCVTRGSRGFFTSVA